MPGGRRRSRGSRAAGRDDPLVVEARGTPVPDQCREVRLDGVCHIVEDRSRHRRAPVVSRRQVKGLPVEHPDLPQRHIAADQVRVGILRIRPAGGGREGEVKVLYDAKVPLATVMCTAL